MPTGSLKPLQKQSFGYDQALHLLNRAGFGGTPSQVRALAEMGLDTAVEYVVDYKANAAELALDSDEFDAGIMRPPSEDERDEFRRARRMQDEVKLEQLRIERQRREREDRQQVASMQRWWLRRMIETPRPLEEKMTLFWHGHFATGYRKIEDSYHMLMQNMLFRRHAVGNFRELTHGIIRDPAMIAYLDNQQNRKQAPNENLARELMELFTLGEGHAYTEDDIKEGARALTGYAFEDDEFIFRPRQHDDGAKRILGRTGTFNGEDFVDIILSQPEASQFICWKLYRFFVNDMPGEPTDDGQAYVLKLARQLRDGKYELQPVLMTMFKSEHFYDPANMACQIKSPTQLVVQAIRSLRTPPRRLEALLSASDLMGQNILNPPSVKGWDGGRAWINTSTMFVRQNLMIYLLTGQRPEAYPWEADGSVYDATHLVEHLKDGEGNVNARDAVGYLLRFCLGAEPHPQRVETLVEFVNAHGGTIDNEMLIALLSLITAMPEYQLC